MLTPRDRVVRYELERDGYVVSDDASRLDIDVIHQFLTQDAYWSRGIDRDLVRRSIEHSLCFGLYASDGQQLGFARVISDRSTFAWLCDVFVVSSARERGLGKWLCNAVVDHPDLQGLRRFLLATADAHALYSTLDFAPLAKPDRFMERYQPARELYDNGVATPKDVLDSH